MKDDIGGKGNAGLAGRQGKSSRPESGATFPGTFPVILKDDFGTGDGDIVPALRVHRRIPRNDYGGEDDENFRRVAGV